jgi:hypothetical protein
MDNAFDLWKFCENFCKLVAKKMKRKRAKNDLWRFTLGKSGSRNLIIIGLTPSTVTKEKSA